MLCVASIPVGVGVHKYLPRHRCVGVSSVFSLWNRSLVAIVQWIHSSTIFAPNCDLIFSLKRTYVQCTEKNHFLGVGAFMMTEKLIFLTTKGKGKWQHFQLNDGRWVSLLPKVASCHGNTSTHRHPHARSHTEQIPLPRLCSHSAVTS